MFLSRTLDWLCLLFAGVREPLSYAGDSRTFRERWDVCKWFNGLLKTDTNLQLSVSSSPPSIALKKAIITQEIVDGEQVSQSELDQILITEDTFLGRCASHFQTRHFTTLRRGNEPALSTLLPRGLFLLKSWEPLGNLGNTTAKWRTLLIRKHFRGFRFYRLCLAKFVDGSYLHFQITTPMNITSDTASRLDKSLSRLLKS